MASIKYEVGDKGTIVGKQCNHQFAIGTKVTLTQISATGEPYSAKDSGGDRWCIAPTDFKLNTPKSSIMPEKLRQEDVKVGQMWKSNDILMILPEFKNMYWNTEYEAWREGDIETHNRLFEYLQLNNYVLIADLGDIANELLKL